MCPEEMVEKSFVELPMVELTAAVCMHIVPLEYNVARII